MQYLWFSLIGKKEKIMTTNMNITYDIAQKAALGLQDLVSNPPALSMISSDQIHQANTAITQANTLSASSTETEIQAVVSAIITAQIPYIQAAASMLSQFASISSPAQVGYASATITSSPIGANITGLDQLGNSIASFQLSGNSQDKIRQAISMAHSLTASSSLTDVQGTAVAVEYAQGLIMQALVPTLQIIVTQMQLTPSQISQGNSVIAQINAINASSTPGQINRILSDTIEVFAYIIITLLPQIFSSGGVNQANVYKNIRSAQSIAQLNDINLLKAQVLILSSMMTNGSSIITSDQLNNANTAIQAASSLNETSSDTDIQQAIINVVMAQIPYIQLGASVLHNSMSSSNMPQPQGAESALWLASKLNAGSSIEEINDAQLAVATAQQVYTVAEANKLASSRHIEEAQVGASILQLMICSEPSGITEAQVNAAKAAINTANSLTSTSSSNDAQTAMSVVAAAQIPYIQAQAALLQGHIHSLNEEQTKAVTKAITHANNLNAKSTLGEVNVAQLAIATAQEAYGNSEGWLPNNKTWLWMTISCALGMLIAFGIGYSIWHDTSSTKSQKRIYQSKKSKD